MRLKYYFIASEQNDYKPWILTSQALVVFCVVIWAIRLLVPETLTLAQGTIDAQDLMNRINAERTQRFIPALTTNGKLGTAANAKAHDMLARSYFAHVDPDGNYVWPRIEATGYKPYITLGENLAMDFTSASAVVDAWMNSPTHRQNIVNAKFEDQGLASLDGQFEPNHDTVMITNLFGTLYKTPKPTPPPPAPVAKNPPPPPVAIIPKPLPTPTPLPAPAPRPVPVPAPVPVPVASTLHISEDIKISSSSVSEHTLINVDVVVNGSPTLVTAKLKTQSITMLAGKVKGQFLGSFTFDQNEDLSEQAITIEARSKSGAKISESFGVNVPAPAVAAEHTTMLMPVSNEAQIIKTLRIIFGIFAAIYMGFLIADAIIIHRLKIKRPGIHTNTHALVFFLVAAVSIFTHWF